MFHSDKITICKKCHQIIDPERFTSNQTYYETAEEFFIIIDKGEGIIQACSDCLRGFIGDNQKYFLSKTDFANRTIITFKKSFGERLLSLLKKKAAVSYVD